MKNFLTALLIGFLTISCVENENNDPEEINSNSSDSKNISLKTELERFSYALGQQVGAVYLRDSVEINLENFYAGFNDGYKRIPNQIPSEEIRERISKFNEKQRLKKEEEFKRKQELLVSQAGKLPKLTQKILVENKKNSNVKVTDSGLQYTLIKQGSPTQFNESHVVRMHSKIWNVDSSLVVDSKTKGPANIIPYELLQEGFREAVKIAGINGEIDILVPPSIGFGKAGMIVEANDPAGPTVPGNSAVFSKLEILDIMTTEEAKEKGFYFPTKEEIENLDLVGEKSQSR